MKSLPNSSRVSIRTILLTMLFLIGGWGLIASLQQVGESWRGYRENRAFAEEGRVAAQLLTVGRHLADERGRTVALLRGAAPAAEKDLVVIEEGRRLGDASLDAALGSEKGLPQDIYAGLLSQRQEVRRLRQRVDREVALPLASRDPQLADRWFGTVTGFIDYLRRSVERLAGENRPGDKITRLTLLSAAMLQLRITEGGEASHIAQALAAGKPPALETLFAIHELRGREDQLWHDIERLAVAANVETIHEKVVGIRKQHLVVFHAQQDGVLAELAARRRVPHALEALAAASLPVLDGMSDLMLQAAEEAVRIGEAAETEARARFVAHTAWLAALLLLLALSLRYALRQVVAPLESVGRELRRMGAFPDAPEKGSEIQHLKASAAVLERSIGALAEAQRLAHIGSWELDHGANVLAWSDECYRIFEIDPQRFGGTYEAFLGAVHPDDRERVDGVFRTSLEKRESYEIEHRLAFPDGRVKYVHEHCETRYGSDGKALRSIGTVQDITERKEMENALRESRRLLAEAQRIARVGSWEYDIATDTHTWSDELFRIFEIDPAADGASYEGCINVTHPDDREAIARAYLNSVETGRPYESQHRLLMADGRIKHVHERGETVRGPDGKLLYAVGMMQDITERKEAERKLKEALEFNEGVVNAIPDILFEVDRNGRYLNVWTHTPELLAVPKEILLGKTVHDVLAPESTAVVMDSLRETEENGLSFGKVIHIDLPHGTSWFELSASKKPGSSPSDGTFLVLSRDITDRRRMERELRSRERMFRTLAENAPDNIIRYDQDCRILYLNPNLEAAFGLPLAEVIGKRPSEVFPDGRYDGIEATVRAVVASGKAADYFLSVPDGELGVRLHHLVIVPERGDLGHVKGVLALGRDVTALKRLEAAREEALAEAQRLAKLRSEFIAHMSHELRTPLNGILGYAQMLERDSALDRKQLEGMAMIRQSGEHLLALLEDILDLARIESCKLELDIADIPLAKFLQFVAGIAGVRAKQKHLEFSCEFASVLPEGIRGDEKRLCQILLNLLSNAVKYTDQGKITLSVARVAPARLAFAVADTGSGIAPADREMIFRPFEQVGGARQRSGGTGLGLAISRQLVRLMGGDIEVESREGEGSIFRFELELPEIEIKPEFWRPAFAELPPAQQDGAVGPPESLIAPPPVEMRELHRLALLGNMRDISGYAERIGALDPRYRPFAEHLIRLADSFQSKAILAFIEGYLT